MDTKKTSKLLKKVTRKKVVKQKQTKPSNVPSKRVVSGTSQDLPSSSDLDSGPFWRKIFNLSGSSVMELNSAYHDMISGLQKDYSLDEKKLVARKNTDPTAHAAGVAKFLTKKKVIEEKLQIIKTLRYKLSCMDHMSLLESRNINYLNKIPIHEIKKFMLDRAATPVKGINVKSSIVGSNTERVILKAKRTRTADDLIRMKQIPELEGIDSRVDYSLAPWFPNVKHILQREDLIEEEGRLVLDGVTIPLEIALYYNGQWWVRVKKSWLTHVGQFGRPYLENKIAYQLKDDSIHIETKKEHKDAEDYLKNKSTANKKKITDLCVGITLDFSNQLIQEGKTLDTIVSFMATLDSNIPGNFNHRRRFYSGHYNAKIVNVPFETILSRVFLDPEITNLVKEKIRKLYEKSKKVLYHYLKTGKNIPNPPGVSGIALDLGEEGENVIWYHSKKKGLQTVELDPTNKKQKFPKMSKEYAYYVSCVLPVEKPETAVEEPEQIFFEIPKPRLLANGLFTALGHYLDQLDSDTSTEQRRIVNIGPVLTRALGNIKSYYRDEEVENRGKKNAKRIGTVESLQ